MLLKQYYTKLIFKFEIFLHYKYYTKLIFKFKIFLYYNYIMDYPEIIDKVPLICKSITRVFNDIEYDKTHNKYRALRDKSTEIFTKYFISNPKVDTEHKRLLTFIDYIFNMMNSKVLLNLNSELKNNGFNTMGNEQVFLLFKGGNNLVVLQDIFEKITNRSNFDINSIPSKIKSNIKISDNDFTINIIAEVETRFNEIYFCVKKLLTHSLLEICDIFNNLMFNMQAFKMVRPKENLEFKQHPFDSLSSNQLLINFFPFTNNELKQDFSKFEELDNMDFENCNNVGVLIQAEYIRSCYKNSNQPSVKIINRIEQLLNHKLSFFYDNIYKENEINMFKEELANEVNNMTNPEKLFYDMSGSCINHYKVVKPVEKDNLEFSGVQNTFIYPSNTFNDGKLGTTIDGYMPVSKFRNIQNAHYMSINGTIYGNTTKIGFNINFDLFRIKCNVLANQEKILYKYCQPNNAEFDNDAIFIPALFNLPSEFVDVSVGHFDDLNIFPIIEEYYKNPKHFINHHLYEFKNVSPENFRSFTMYSSELIVDDLINTLFRQRYSPQFDSKYNKRLVRLFYFYCMYNTIKDKSSDNLCKILNLMKTEFMKISNSMSNCVENSIVVNNSFGSNFASNTSNNDDFLIKSLSNAKSLLNNHHSINTLNKNEQSTKQIIGGSSLTNISPIPSFNTSFYNIPYNFDILVNYSLDKPLFKFVDVKPEYALMQPLLNFILTYKTIYESNANYVTEFAKRYNDIYSIIDNSTSQELFVSFQLFLSECIGILDYCINMFCSEAPHPEDQIYNYVTSVSDEQGTHTLIKTEEDKQTKYSYLVNNEITFSFTVPNITIANDIETCMSKCKGNDGEDICCDDKNKKYETIINEYNKIPNGSVEKEKMKQLLNIFFKSK